MSEYKAHKWITSGKGKALNVHKVQSVFGPVACNPCSLISIFGRARQGKSFLMNCLAGEREIFKISNEKDSCTQGIDISNKWMTLAEFSRIDGAKMVSGRSEGIKVGFVDAEGQGDKDVSYDANLICPILLASKCVIFNWKGDLQKDHILNTLGVMARAAQNISDDTGSTSASSAEQGAKFGHLHVIFRDWQAVKTDEAAVFNTLLGIEGTAESTTRDLIRADLLSAFASIRVWLFDPPSEFTKDLKQKLSFEKTSATFRGQVRALREALAQQLREPTTIAGHVLTGRAYVPLSEQIAAALNSGEVVLPSSAYLGMMRQEALQLVQRYDADLRARVQELLDAVDRPFAGGVGNAGKGTTETVYPTTQEVDAQLQKLFTAVGEEYQAKIADITGNVPPAKGSIVATIVTEYEVQVAATNKAVRTQFIAEYGQRFTAWLLRARRAAEQLLEKEVEALRHKLPVFDEDPASPLSLRNQLQALYSTALRRIGGSVHYGADCAEAADAERVLDRHFLSLAEPLHAENAKILEQRRNEGKQHVRAALTAMEAALETTVADLLRSRPSGYLMKELEEQLNTEFHRLNKGLQQHLQHSAMRADLLVQFEKDCGALRGRMVVAYNAAKEAALRQGLQQAKEAVDALLSAFDVEQVWGEVPLEERGPLLDACLSDLTENAIASCRDHLVGGWLLTSVVSNQALSPDEAAQLTKEQQFLASLHATVNGPVEAFRSACQQRLDALAVEERANRGPVRMAPGYGADESDEEQEDEEMEVEAPMKAVDIGAGNGKAGGRSSVEDQRRKAAEWARSQGISTGKGKPAQRRGKTVAPAKAPVKSVEQQRADALAYAKKLFGEHIGDRSPPAKKAASKSAASNRASGNVSAAGFNPFSRQLEGADQGDVVGRKRGTADEDGSRKQASAGNTLPSPPLTKAAPAPPAPAAPAPAAKMDPVKAAREEQRRLAEERAAASAAAAAERARAAKAKKGAK